MEDFGSKLWAGFIAVPLGSKTKRELELMVLRAALGAGLLAPVPEKLATACNVPLTRAHGYLTDLALRQAPLNDEDAVKYLILLLKDSEVVNNEGHFSIPIQDAALRIWLERKMAALHLNAGDTLRRDHVKLTPAGLARLIGASTGIATPLEALKKLPAELKDAQWVTEAKRTWKRGMSWPEALGLLGNTAAIGQAVLPNLLLGVMR
jgi:hypothetical protein